MKNTADRSNVLSSSAYISRVRQSQNRISIIQAGAVTHVAPQSGVIAVPFLSEIFAVFLFHHWFIFVYGYNLAQTESSFLSWVAHNFVCMVHRCLGIYHDSAPRRRFGGMSLSKTSEFSYRDRYNTTLTSTATAYSFSVWLYHPLFL